MDDVESIAQTVAGLAGAYERLALVVGEAGSGRSTAVAAAAEQHAWALVNVGLSLSERLLDVAPPHRAAKVSGLLTDLIAEGESSVVLLDDIEVLFEPSLQLDPLGLLRDLARYTTLVVVWPGEANSDSLTYATPSHPEHRQYSAAHLPLISVR